MDRTTEAHAVVDRIAFTVTLERLFILLRRIGPADLSLTTVSTLHALDRDGPRRLTDLACGEGLTQPGMTQLVSRLERDGLARRCTDPSDGRVVLVQITTAGQELLRRRRIERAEQLAGLVDGLDAGDAAAIAAALPALDRLASTAA
jgi:DNA-binding MarR family transcriptional regulator